MAECGLNPVATVQVSAVVEDYLENGHIHGMTMHAATAIAGGHDFDISAGGKALYIYENGTTNVMVVRYDDLVGAYLDRMHPQLFTIVDVDPNAEGEA